MIEVGVGVGGNHQQRGAECQNCHMRVSKHERLREQTGADKSGVCVCFAVSPSSCQSAALNQVTGGPTAAARAVNHRHRYGILIYLNMAYWHNMLNQCACTTITACIPLALLHNV